MKISRSLRYLPPCGVVSESTGNTKDNIAINIITKSLTPEPPIVVYRHEQRMEEIEIPDSAYANDCCSVRPSCYLA